MDINGLMPIGILAFDFKLPMDCWLEVEIYRSKLGSFLLLFVTFFIGEESGLALNIIIF